MGTRRDGDFGHGFRTARSTFIRSLGHYHSTWSRWLWQYFAVSAEFLRCRVTLQTGSLMLPNLVGGHAPPGVSCANRQSATTARVATINHHRVRYFACACIQRGTKRTGAPPDGSQIVARFKEV
jgi:hypothetical protein